jgi:hypothetical protein
MMPFRSRIGLPALLCLMVPAPAIAQQHRPQRPIFHEVVTIGSSSEDSIRLAQLLDDAPSAGFLIRESGSLTPPLMRGLEVIAPTWRSTWNSDLPFSYNESALWAGRGLNLAIMGGVRTSLGPVLITLAPELLYQENLPFQVIPSPLPDRDPFASPWHTNPESMDLPLRFGSGSHIGFSAGQSSLRGRTGGIELGLSTENQWWGPGIRNAIVMSNNAPGFPHAFVRTAAPLRTRVGRFEGKVIVGRLSESAYFDTIARNDHRSISAAVVTFAPAAAPDLTLGFARAVYAPMDELTDLVGSVFHVLQDTGRPNARPATDLERRPGPDQIFSLFGRWVLPESGFEAYAEWARNERPSSLRDFLVAPHHSQGYTLGIQWARPAYAGVAFRLQAESSFLEASTTSRYRRVTGFYKSRPVLQGYTHDGRVIGAAIGSGGSSQWLAADLVGAGSQLGLFAGRIRWENDAFFSNQVPPFIFDHDVSVFGGVRGGYAFPALRVDAEVFLANRMNYLFQNPSVHLHAPTGVDIRNLTVRLRLRPISRTGPNRLAATEPLPLYGSAASR